MNCIYRDTGKVISEDGIAGILARKLRLAGSVKQEIKFKTFPDPRKPLISRAIEQKENGYHQVAVRGELGW